MVKTPMSAHSQAELAASLARHRMRHRDAAQVQEGVVRFCWTKGPWFMCMAALALLGGAFTVSAGALALYVGTTALVLLFGHSLGSHRKLVHDSFQCPRWLEYLLVYLGVQVGLA